MTKILPSPILPVWADLHDRLDHLLGEVGGHRDLDLHLGQEVHVVFRAAVDLGLALLPAEALHLGDGEALHAERRQRLAHIVELEGLDDGHDQLHRGFLLLPVRGATAPHPDAVLRRCFQEPCRPAALARVRLPRRAGRALPRTEAAR